MVFSVVVPVYNRPREIDELLDSLLSQDYPDFEVIIVEDGSSVTCEDIVRSYGGKLNCVIISKTIKDRVSPVTLGWKRQKAITSSYLILIASFRPITFPFYIMNWAEET